MKDHHQLALLIQQYGWPTGAEKYATGCNRAESVALSSECGLRHTAWKALINPKCRAAALVFEQGLGSVSISLARDFEKVYAVCSDPDHMLVMKSRAEWLGIQNIEVFCHSELEERLARVRLDACVIHDIAPAKLNAGVFKVIVRRLTETAVVYTSVQRSAVNYRLLGRIVAGLGRELPRISFYRYSSSAGLADVFEISELAKPYLSFKEALSRCAAPFRAPGFGLRLTRAGFDRSLVDEVLDEVGAIVSRDSARPRLMIERYLFSNPYGVTLLIRGSQHRTPMVIRIPLSEQAIERNRVNYATLNALQAVHGFESTSVPKPLHNGTVREHEIFVETRVAGRMIERRTLKDDLTYAAVLREATKWITELHLQTVQPCSLKGDRFDRLVTEPLEAAFRILEGNAHSSLFQTIKQFLTESLYGATIGLVLSHGDYSIDNVLIEDSGARIKGVFDWDIAQIEGFPLLDVLHFFLTAERVRTRKDTGSIFREKILPLCFTEEESSLLNDYCRAMKIDDRLLLPLAVLSWINHVAVRTYNPERYRFTSDLSEIAGDALPLIVQLLMKQPNYGQEVG